MTTSCAKQTFGENKNVLLNVTNYASSVKITIIPWMIFTLVFPVVTCLYTWHCIEFFWYKCLQTEQRFYRCTPCFLKECWHQSPIWKMWYDLLPKEAKMPYCNYGRQLWFVDNPKWILASHLWTPWKGHGLAALQCQINLFLGDLDFSVFSYKLKKTLDW